MAEVVTTPDGRHLAYLAVGDPHGAVWHPVKGAGHFVAVGAGDEIFALAAKELGAP